jgi:hypothetical protein
LFSRKKCRPPRLGRGGGRIGVEEPLHAEPPHTPASHAFGESREVGDRDRSGRQERDAVTGRQEEAVGDAGVEVDVAVECRAEAVEE